MLSLDARRAAELHDGGRVEADLMAMLGLGRQLHDSDGILISQLVGLGVDRLAVQQLKRVLSEHADVLTDAQLTGFAHLLARPQVAADLIDTHGERYFFNDIIQRLYTDDGHGDGRMTLSGAQILPMFMGTTFNGEASPSNIPLVFASSLPMLIASRAEMTGKYNEMMDQTDANLQQPLRLVDRAALEAKIRAVKQPVESIHYLLVSILFPSLENAQKSCERYLGERDGTLVGISLELYRRRHGQYPAALTELVPELLPQIPADRITGDPVKYRLIDGKPIVYSVGADRIDDGGKRPDSDHALDPARWDVKPADAARGDWILYPPDPVDQH